MQKEEFKKQYSKQLNLDNKVWDLPFKAVVGFKSQIHPFYVQVSLKQEIDVDCLYYFIKNNLYELNVANNLHIFLDQKNRESLGITEVKKGKLTALKIPSSYLTKIKTLDDTNDINFFNKVEFPIKDVIVKPIDDYLADKPFEILSFEEKKDDFNPFLIDYSESFKNDNLQITFDELIDKPIIEKSNYELTIENRIKFVKELLLTKGKEYIRNNNYFHNFDKGAAFTGECREKVLWGFLLKHIISIQDMINDMNNNKDFIPDKKVVSEKISDNLIYLLLLECSIEDKRQK